MVETRGVRRTRIVVATSLLLAGIACQTPVGVKVADPEDVERGLGANILVTDELSSRTKNMLRWSGLREAYFEDRVTTLARIHTSVITAISVGDPIARKGLAALAEMAFDIGKREKDSRYFLQAVIYARAYLVPEDSSFAPGPLDPRVQLAIGLYNRGLARAFSAHGVRELEPRSGRVELPFGFVDVRVDEESRRWEGKILDTFTLLSELKVRGMRNRYRWSGFGAPLAATIRDPEGASPLGDRLFPEVRIPVAALLLFDDFWGDFASGEFEASLTFRVGYDHESVTLDGKTVPLSMEPTASLAYMLSEASPWRNELRGFFSGDLSLDSNDGISALQPYRRGKIPIVMVHGTASGPARWAELLNDSMADRQIRENYQFWLFTYSTGNPIAYSGWLLRESIRGAIDSIDPEDRDDALDRMVVMGHSQGGLLTKLAVIDSGTRFWDRISDVPIEELDLAPESREILAGSLLVKPVPEVERVIFMATPHRGSYAAAWGISQWFGSMTRAPANLANAVGDLVTQDEVAVAVRELDRVDGAVANMSPGSEFIQTLAEIPIVPRVAAHSIIAVRGDGPLEDLSDGVVAYESAHIDGVESEKVIQSGHSVQNNPHLSQEVRRILLLHLEIGRSAVEAVDAGELR